MTHSREVHLKRRPVGLPTADAFELVTVDLPAPGPGQVLVKNLYLSVDPYMRGRMVDRKSYTPPFQLGEAMTGGAVGTVAVSNHADFAVGDTLLSMYGWREAFLSDGRGLTKVDPTLAPVESYLGVMGMPGMTAYFGLLDIGAPQPGETVFVSGAAGAVGSVVCQIAKLKGCRVVGSAGSEAKVAWLPRPRAWTRPSTTRPCPRLRRWPSSVPTAWMSTSTTWAATIWRPRSSA